MMQAGHQPSTLNPQLPLEALRRQALFLDLEVDHSGRLLKIGAVYKDRTFARSGNFSREMALSELGEIAGAAGLVLGHNLIAHDLRLLREMAPAHPLLR